jgi:hypothetical protein
VHGTDVSLAAARADALLLGGGSKRQVEGGAQRHAPQFVQQRALMMCE